MQFHLATKAPAGVRLIARVVNQNDTPDDLDAALVDGAKAARFIGGAGQVFEHFSMTDGELVRMALAGAGEVEAAQRALNVEKAGAGLAAKYLASGETDMVLDLSHADLSGQEAASVLFGLRLRSWRFFEYRTKLSADKRATLEHVHVIG